MNAESQIRAALESLVAFAEEDHDTGEMIADEHSVDLSGASTRSFSDAGVLTSYEGMVLRLSDGSEYQITIMQSRGAF